MWHSGTRPCYVTGSRVSFRKRTSFGYYVSPPEVYYIQAEAMLVQAFLEGKATKLQPWLCDVRDIGKAHVRCAEMPTAEGRHLVRDVLALIPTHISLIVSAKIEVSVHVLRIVQRGSCTMDLACCKGACYVIAIFWYSTCWQHDHLPPCIHASQLMMQRKTCLLCP